MQWRGDVGEAWDEPPVVLANADETATLFEAGWPGPVSDGGDLVGVGAYSVVADGEPQEGHPQLQVAFRRLEFEVGFSQLQEVSPGVRGGFPGHG